MSTEARLSENRSRRWLLADRAAHFTPLIRAGQREAGQSSPGGPIHRGRPATLIGETQNSRCPSVCSSMVHSGHMCQNVRTYTYACMYVYVCMYVCTCYVRMYVCVCMYVGLCMCVCMYACM